MRQARASPVRRPGGPAKQGVHQEYIVLLSLHRQSLQNKQCFHNQYMHTCLLLATIMNASMSASDSASVYASNSASVYASDSASDNDSASVYASVSATAYASNSASVYATDSASVYAIDSASVSAIVSVA